MYSTYLGGSDRDDSEETPDSMWRWRRRVKRSSPARLDRSISRYATRFNRLTPAETLTRLSRTSTPPVISRYSTYLGGSGSDVGRRVAVDPAGAVVVVGATDSADFWTRHALQSANAGAEDVFIARIGPPPPPDTIAPTSFDHAFRHGRFERLVQVGRHGHVDSHRRWGRQRCGLR